METSTELFLKILNLQGLFAFFFCDFFKVISNHILWTLLKSAQFILWCTLFTTGIRVPFMEIKFR